MHLLMLPSIFCQCERVALSFKHVVYTHFFEHSTTCTFSDVAFDSFCLRCERLWHSILETLTSGSHGNVGLFLEGQALTKSDENHCFYRGKFQSQVSIARVALVLSEEHVHTKVAKTTGFTEGMRNRRRRAQRVALLPSVWHVRNLLLVRKIQSQRKRRCFKVFLTSVTRCKRRYPQPFSSTFRCCLR